MWSESESFVNFRYLESENFRRNFKCAYATANECSLLLMWCNKCRLPFITIGGSNMQHEHSLLFIPQEGGKLNTADFQVKEK